MVCARGLYIITGSTTRREFSQNSMETCCLNGDNKVTKFAFFGNNDRWCVGTKMLDDCDESSRRIPQTRMRFFRINTVSIIKLLVENIIWKWMMMNGREERIHSNSQTLEPVVLLEGNRDSKVNIILVQI